MNTASESSKPESGTDCLTTPPSGPIYLPSTAASAEAWWTSLREDFRARTSALPGQEQESTVLEAAYGGKCLDAFGKWDPDTSLLRTFQASLLEDRLEPWSGSFPPSGTMRSGTAYRLRSLVPRTSVGGGGVLPTPHAGNWERNQDAYPGARRRLTLQGMAKMGMWPTPKAQDAKHGTLAPSELAQGEGYQKRHLHAAVMWPTPKGSLEHYGQPRENDWGDLQAAVLTWPTPNATDWKGPSMRSAGKERHSSDDDLPTRLWRIPDSCPRGGQQEADKRQEAGHSVNLQDQVGGQLNPRFVEYLMGLPQGWVALEPLIPESWLQWCQGCHWADGEWPGVPRVAIGVMHRVGQLRALGNGVVPAVVKRFLEGQ